MIVIGNVRIIASCTRVLYFLLPTNWGANCYGSPKLLWIVTVLTNLIKYVMAASSSTHYIILFFFFLRRKIKMCFIDY